MMPTTSSNGAAMFGDGKSSLELQLGTQFNEDGFETLSCADIYGHFVPPFVAAAAASVTSMGKEQQLTAAAVDAMAGMEPMQSESWLEDASDLKAFLDLETVDEVKHDESAAPYNAGRTDDLIDDMEDFLNNYETAATQFSRQDNSSAFMENDKRSFLANTYSAAMSSDSDPSDGDLGETAEAERLLDALIRGNISCAGGGLVAADAAAAAEVLNVSQVMVDGRNVIIVIAPSSPGAEGSNPTSPATADSYDAFTSPGSAISMASPAPSAAGSESSLSSDIEWTPNSPEAATPKTKIGKFAATARGGRGLARRQSQPYKPKRPEVMMKPKPRKTLTIQDKKERKKWQNVEAARRYRDKKKNEASVVEDEEKVLSDRNTKLRETVADMEAEMKTLKRLMTELGLIKLLPASQK